MKKIILLMLPIFISVISFQPGKNITITGSVTDMSGNPLSATVSAGKIYVVTDAQGKYSITIDANTTFLLFAAAGYEDEKIEINHQNIINVKLKRALDSLEQKTVAPFENRRLLNQAANAQTLVKGKMDGIVSTPYPSNSIYDHNFNTEDYDNITENGFKSVADDPLSTFSIDVDAASYSNVRRFLQNNELPPAGAVRTEEMINYFSYAYPQPAGDDPFSINTELSECPWNAENKLLLIGLQGKKIPVDKLPSSNLVFLIDVSGSMNWPNKLPLVRSSMKMLTDQLRENDRISIVVYAGQAGLKLSATPGNEKIKIKKAIDGLEAGGSTAGGEGIKLAYKIALQNFMEEGNNRVILCTDGDFNIGMSSDDALVRLIEKERENGIFLTVLGYGMGNYKDNKMQKLADKGNGNHAYIDGLSEAKKVLVKEFGGTLFTIAKDVKLQVEFNPEAVAGYRLIGYENRMLNKEDFNDDKKDAGELGSGHTVTAIYEIIPIEIKSEFLKDVDPLKYQHKKSNNESVFRDEAVTIKFRYKTPTGNTSKLMVHTVKNAAKAFKHATPNLKFAASVAEFAMLLRDSEFKESSTFNHVLQMAGDAMGPDEEGYRKEFISLVKKASALKSELVKKE